MKKRSENLIKGRDQKHGRQEAAGSDGKGLAVTAGRKGSKADAKPVAPAAGTTPDESWELPALAEFIARVVRRNGEDAWWIGMALYIARKKYKQERDWLRWLREEVRVISRSTAYRYLDVCSSFTLDEVKDKPINVLYKLMQLDDEPEAPAGEGCMVLGIPGVVRFPLDTELEAPAGEEDGDSMNVAAGTEDCDPTPDNAAPEETVIPGRIAGTASSAASERGTDNDAEVSPKPQAPPQPPVTAAELDALTSFVEAVGGLTRAEHVFHAGIDQIRDLKND